MRKNLVAAIIVLTLLSVSIRAYAVSSEQTPANSTRSAAEDLERVYGIDYSRTIFSQVSQSSFRDYIIKLTENGSRWIASPSSSSEANIAARNWIADELTSVSNTRIQAEILGEYNSVLGRLPGYLSGDCPAILVGGHFDSTIEAAGANDDGAGVAGMLELARVLSLYNWPLDVYFGAWNAEEIGLIGSSEVANILNERDVDLLVHYNVDMLLVPNPYSPTVLMAYPIGSYHDGEYWADLPMTMSSNYGQDGIEPVPSSNFTGWYSSDHWPFIQEGYVRSLFAHESGFAYDAAYHTSGDIWSNPLYDYGVATEAVKSIGASIAFTMSRAFQQMVHGTEKFDLEPDSCRNFSIVISKATTLNITSRWWGGPITASLYGPNDEPVNQVVRNDTSPWVASRLMEQAITMSGVYEIQVLNHGSSKTGYEVSWEFDSDIDGNGVPDSQEFWFDVAYFSIDSDSDALSDAQEMILGTSPIDDDSDTDGMPDGWEVDNGFDPMDPSDAAADDDGDTLTNLSEYLFGCSPRLVDSDSDQMPDNYEVEHDLNPTVNDALEDPDNDLVSNLDEYLAGTDPRYAELRLERMLIPVVAIAGVALILAGAVYVWHKRQ